MEAVWELTCQFFWWAQKMRLKKCSSYPLHEGMVTEETREKTKIILGTQSKARARWAKRLRLVHATPWADFAVITAQLWSTMTVIFSGWTILLSTVIYDLDSRITAKYSKCQTSFYSMQVSFGFHSVRSLRYLYLQVSAQRFESGGFIEPRRFRIIFL